MANGKILNKNCLEQYRSRILRKGCRNSAIIFCDRLISGIFNIFDYFQVIEIIFLPYCFLILFRFISLLNYFTSLFHVFFVSCLLPFFIFTHLSLFSHSYYFFLFLSVVHFFLWGSFLLTFRLCSNPSSFQDNPKFTL